jgi:hypothetical protein
MIAALRDGSNVSIGMALAHAVWKIVVCLSNSLAEKDQAFFEPFRRGSAKHLHVRHERYTPPSKTCRLTDA